MSAQDKIAEALALIAPLTGHTPPPWEWRIDEDCPEWGRTYALAPGILLPDGSDGTPEGDEIDQANARLIAAAPDMRDTIAALADLAEAQAQRIEALECYVAKDALRDEFAAWSQSTFGDVSAVGPAKHLSKEALEVAADPTDATEHADCQMLLWDMQRRAGISDADLIAAIAAKLAVNKARVWPAPMEGEAREHDRSQGETP